MALRGRLRTTTGGYAGSKRGSGTIDIIQISRPITSMRRRRTSQGVLQVTRCGSISRIRKSISSARLGLILTCERTGRQALADHGR